MSTKLAFGRCILPMYIKSVVKFFICKVTIFTFLDSIVAGLIINGNKALIDAIKHNLQTNNDDYLEDTIINTKTVSNVTLNNTLADITEGNNSNNNHKKQTVQKNTDANNREVINRRSYNNTFFAPIQPIPQKMKFMNETTLNTSSTETQNFRNKWSGKLLLPPKREQVFQSDTEFNTMTIKPMQNKSKLSGEKIKQLIQLKRNLTKQMTVKKQPMKELKESLPLPDKRKVEVKDVIKSAARKRSNKLLKSGKVLNPEMLDMIAAKDNRLNSKRSKGRLCNRHVLIPEGPKYDSAGRVYLPAHADSQPFERTPRPRLLLPICCNCCKKSVLGCQ